MPSNKSNFRNDLNEEQRLAVFLDNQYHIFKIFEPHYQYKRVHDMENQFKGIDFIVRRKDTGVETFVDEKAQLDYIGQAMPTFAFEISYFNRERQWKKGWLFDENKSTDQYFLITCIMKNRSKEFESCRVVYVDRYPLISYLNKVGLNEDKVFEYEKKFREENYDGKIEISELSAKEAGYFYFSNSNKAEKPINLILRLNFLIKQGFAKEIMPCRKKY